MKSSYLSACREYFGQKPDQGIKEFAAEAKELSDRDRMDLAHGLAAEGILSPEGLAKAQAAEGCEGMGPRPGYGA